MKYDPTLPCPCKSGATYADCCQSFHNGALPGTALQLMRSRYAAYALCIPAYIIHTTHPQNPQFSRNTAEWAKKIIEFCTTTEFKDLKILNSEEKDSIATVTFFAQLTQNKKDASFTEKSLFKKVNRKWLYESGLIF